MNFENKGMTIKHDGDRAYIAWPEGKEQAENTNQVAS
jgi:hypothetical protein